MTAEEKMLHGRPQKVETEQRELQDEMERAVALMYEGTKKISDGLKVYKLWDLEAGMQLIEFQRQKQ